MWIKFLALGYSRWSWQGLNPRPTIILGSSVRQCAFPLYFIYLVSRWFTLTQNRNVKNHLTRDYWTYSHRDIWTATTTGNSKRDSSVVTFNQFTYIPGLKDYGVSRCYKLWRNGIRPLYTVGDRGYAYRCTWARRLLVYWTKWKDQSDWSIPETLCNFGWPRRDTFAWYTYTKNLSDLKQRCTNIQILQMLLVLYRLENKKDKSYLVRMTHSLNTVSKCTREFFICSLVTC